MNKPPRIIAFQDDVNYRYAILESDISSTELIDRLYQAQKDAEAENYIGTTSNIPKTHLMKYGIKLTPIEPIIIPDTAFGQTPAEKRGVYHATCRDCWHYDHGVCSRYYGTCDPDTEETDCIAAEDIHILRYNREHHPFILPLRLPETTKLPENAITWVLEALKENGDEISEDIEILEQEHDYDLENWSLTATM